MTDLLLSSTFELRWLVAPHTTTEPPRLQYRALMRDLSGQIPDVWSDWQDVPRVVEGSSDD